MVHGFAIELLWVFTHPEEPHGFTSFGHRYCPAQSPPTPGVSKKVIWCVSMCPSTVHLADTRPHNSTTLAYGSMAHTSFIGSTHAIIVELVMHRHVRITFFRFPFVNLAHITSHSFFPDDALNPPSSSPPPYPRRHVLAAALSPSGHHFSSSSKYHPRSIIICPRQTTGPSYSRSTPSTAPATRSATATPTQVALTSATVNAVTTMTPQMSLGRCHSLVRVRRREPRQPYIQLK